MEPVEPEAIDVDAILALVSSRRGLDFRDYRRAAIERGIARRMRARAIPTLDAYGAALLDDDVELDALVGTLVVPLTAFFRDAPVFDALRMRVVPALARRFGRVRAWSVGTATGEEAWSVAALLEERRHAGEMADWDVLGTDIDEASLATARAGRYAALPEVFGPEGPDEGLRRRVRFARHDLLGPTAAPAEALVASFPLVLCRNVLIYFDARLQEKALARLVAAVPEGGALVLGPAESAPARGVSPFPGVDACLRVFQVAR